MNKPSPDTESILECLRRTARETLERKRRLGQYAVIWEDGRIKKLSPETQPVLSEISEDKTRYRAKDGKQS